MKSLTIASLFLITLFCCQKMQAQSEGLRTGLRVWYPGNVTLQDETVLNGQINYNYIEGLVRIKTDSVVQTFAANQIMGFSQQIEGEREEFQGLDLGGGHRFYRLIGQNSQVAFLVFYQPLEAKFDALSIATFAATSATAASGGNAAGNVPQDLPTPPYRRQKFRNIIAVTATGEQFAFNKTKGLNVTAFNRTHRVNKREVISFLKRFDPSIEGYIKKNGLNIRNLDDLEQILQKTLKPFEGG